MRTWLVSVVLAAGVAACGSSDAPPAVCASGKGWGNGDDGSPLMHPGGTCLSCHASQGDEAPAFELAGTVMLAANDDEDCDGLAGAIVVVTGDDGAIVELQTNPAGNFFRTIGEGDALVTPYKVAVRRGSKTTPMLQAPSSGDCNTCHSPTAPGRIVAPE